MGTGGKSSHQSYAVAPTAAPAPTAAAADTDTTAGAGPLPPEAGAVSPQVSEFLGELLGAIETALGPDPVDELTGQAEQVAEADPDGEPPPAAAPAEDFET